METPFSTPNPNLKLPKSEATHAEDSFYDQLPDILQYPYSVSPVPAPTKRKQTMGTSASSSSSQVIEQARKRRKTVSEKIRTLSKILPWEKKMNTATILGEAYKYIKFLQAQVIVLQSMPCQSSMDSSGPSSSGVNVNGGLEKLNRQQLLQVLVNSDVVQTLLASEGSCVYSLEQLLLLNSNHMEKVIMYGP